MSNTTFFIYLIVSVIWFILGAFVFRTKIGKKFVKRPTVTKNGVNISSSYYNIKFIFKMSILLGPILWWAIFMATLFFLFERILFFITNCRESQK